MGAIKILSLDLSLNLPAAAVGVVENGVYNILDTYYVDNKDGKAAKLTTAGKLYRIARMFYDIKEQHGDIEYIVREKGFSRFPATTQKLFKVVGLSDYLGIKLFGCTDIAEIPPTTVKSMIAGYGKATKDEVMAGVISLLPVDKKDYEYYSDDVSDAVAVGLTFSIKQGWLK